MGCSNVGVVVSNKPDKTVIVQVIRRSRHKKYGKVVVSRKKFYAHDPFNLYKIGDRVEISHSRPFSALKRWIVTSLIVPGGEKSGRDE